LKARVTPVLWPQGGAQPCYQLPKKSAVTTLAGLWARIVDSGSAQAAYLSLVGHQSSKAAILRMPPERKSSAAGW
jgi:hypothetical protein